MFRYSILLAWLLLLPPPVAAQQPLYGRHSLSIQVGLLNHATAETSVGVGRTDSRVDGFAGTLTYTYQAAPEWAAVVSIGLLEAEIRTGVDAGSVTTEAASVVPVLFGARYAPLLSMRPTVRPYVSAAAGPYLGSATVSRVDAGVREEVVSETAFGFHAMAGIDWYMGRHFLIGVGAGYHFVSDFDERIGSDKNYSGPDFWISLGFAFGTAR